MSPITRIRMCAVATVAALASLVAPIPAFASEPMQRSESETSLICQTLTGPAGEVFVSAAANSASGSAGVLRYWAAPADPDNGDPPTLVSDGITVTLNPDGAITASYDLYAGGGLGLDDTDPVFVGTAELIAQLEAGASDEISETVQRGNTRYVVRGISQSLTITFGALELPAGESFDLADGDCHGTAYTTTTFETRPDATVSTGELIELECFTETSDGFVVVSGQAGITETFLMVGVVDGSDSYFGYLVDPALSVQGIDGSVAIVLDADSSIVGTADVSADFDVVERFKGRIDEPGGWSSETEYVLSVDGAITIDAPGVSLELPMDDCFAEAQIGMRLAR